VRSVDGDEVNLESYRLASDRAGLFDAVVEAVAAGMPVRGVEKCHGGAVKRTQASEMWVEQSRAELERLRERSLVAEDWLALWIDGVHIGNERCVIAAIGLHADGTKEVLDFEPGASENTEVCRLLLERISQRGFAPPPGQRLLVIRDDAKALKKAISRFWPQAIQQECLVHAERVVLAKLPHKAKEEAVRLFHRLRSSQGKSAGEEAFGELLGHVAAHNDAAATCLRDHSFLSTNVIENVFRNWRSATHHVKRWQKGGEMVSRWTATGLLKAEEGFRRVRAFQKLPQLAAALRFAPDSASAPEEVGAAPSSCAPAESGNQQQTT